MPTVGAFLRFAGAVAAMPTSFLSSRRRLRALEARERGWRQRADDERRATAELLSLIYNSASDAMYLLAVEEGTDGARRYRCLSVNESCLTVTGFASTQVVGRTAAEILPEPALSYALGKYDEAIAAGAPIQYEEEITLPQGRLTVETRITPVFDDAGRCTHLLGAVRDVTGRRRAEEALRASEQELRALIGAMSDVVLVIDATGTYQRVAPTAPSLLYLTPEALVGRRLHDVFPAAQADEFARAIQRALSTGRVEHIEYTLEVPTGSMLFAAALSPLSSEAVLWVARDVTEHRRAEQELRGLEEQLRQAQKMEAMGRLAGGVAHDFNNLLTAIKCNCALLLTEPAVGPEQREGLEEIDKAADRAAVLTRQLLAFSRRQALVPRAVDVNGVVREMEGMLRRLMVADVMLTTRLEPRLGRVSADVGQLEQVLMNLAVNARDAMPSGGRMAILTWNADIAEPRPTRHGTIEPGRYVVLSVSDEGSGMNEEVLQHLFEPFFTTKELGKGTGLGLSTVYGIVTQSQGHIAVESAPGRGSTFTIYLPRLSEPACEGVAAPPGTVARARATLHL